MKDWQDVRMADMEMAVLLDLVLLRTPVWPLGQTLSPRVTT